MISATTIQQILETVRIEEVIGDFVSVKRRGSNYVALCPFHNEKTPSFHISPSKSIFKCFGCGKAGNSVNFIMEHEHYTYPEALKFLAKKYNIEIEEEEIKPEDKEIADERESLYNISTFAQKYFANTLFESEEGKAYGLTYFKERGFNESIIHKFGLGYSPDKWTGFYDFALSNGYKIENLIKSGLIKDKDGKQYDAFRNRIIFPIHNLSGRVIGFGGRILTNEKTVAKYINSPESDIYHKSDVLYGIYFAKQSIIKNDNCFLVEGYTDVISLHIAGIENVVASSGTSLTSGQIKLIKRYTNNITILYDGDDAGIKASFRGIDMILEEGMNVRIVLFPDGEDPDSYSRKNRPADVLAFINTNSSDFIIFKTKTLLKEINNDPIKKSSLIREIINSISLIPDTILRSEYIKECSKNLNVSEQTLINELNKILRKKFIKDVKPEIQETIPESDEFTKEKQIAIEEDTFEVQENELIRLLLSYGNKNITFQTEDPDDQRLNKQLIDVTYCVANYIIDNLKNDQTVDGNLFTFNNSVYQKIFESYMTQISKIDTNSELGISNNDISIPDENYWLNHDVSEIRETAISLLTSQHSLSKNWKQMHDIDVITEEKKLRDVVRSVVLSLKLKRILKNIELLNKQLKENNNETEEILKLLVELLKIRNNIANELARIVIK